MKIETPQILWHCDNDSGKNAPLYSVALLESGLCDDSLTDYGHVLATAGNTSDIHLWKVSFRKDHEGKRILQQSQATQPYHSIQHMLTLSRHDRSVNTIAFSPDGLHLATAGDGGSIIIWSIPPSKRGNQNGRHFWSSLAKEQDLYCRILSSSQEGICDISWSADSKRFVAGSIDHTVLIYEDATYDANQTALRQSRPQVEPQWRPVYRNARDHNSFVQGVSYDPLGVYVASMGSDRTVRLYTRKTPPKAKKKVLRPKNAASGILVPPEHQQVVERVLVDSKLELTKAKTLKYRHIASNTDDQQQAPKKQYLFADESTVESFFRRLSWTADGAFLVTPAALWHPEQNMDKNPSFATYIFARHRFDQPYMVLSGLEKPSVVIRPNPVLFELPEAMLAETKENESGEGAELPYRSVFAVLTLDSVLIYDTHHTKPLAIARGLHYAGLTDCTWSCDGRNLLVTSTDGYLSIISFADGELGKVYTPPKPAVAATATAAPTENAAPADNNTSTTHTATALQETAAPQAHTTLPQSSAPPSSSSSSSPRIPPCAPGQTASLEARPSKKTRITPTLISPTPLQTKTDAATVANTAESVKKGLTKMSLQTSEPPKKKKRIQPTLLSTN